MTEHKIHRYSDKVSAHIEKHAKSLNNNPEDDEKDGWKEFHSEGKMRMFRRDEATPDGRIIDPLRLFHTIDKVSAYECQHYSGVGYLSLTGLEEKFIIILIDFQIIFFKFQPHSLIFGTQNTA